MSKVGIFSDLHLHPWPEFATMDSLGRNSRMMDCADVFDRVLQVVEEESLERVFFLGDMLHKRAVLHTLAFNLAATGVAGIAERVPVVLVPGNHDQVDREGKEHALDAMQYIPNVLVMHEPCVYAGFLFVPHQPDATKLKKAFMGRSWDYAFIHAGVEGASVGSYEARPPEEFKVADFGKVTKDQIIFSGHYHKHQVLAGGRFVYIGAPLQHTRADAGEDRGMLLLDTDTGVWERKLFHYPRFVKLDSATISSTPMKQWDVTGNFVDFVLDEEPKGGIERFRTMAGKIGAKGINITYQPPPVKSEKRLDVDPAMSLPVMLERYVDEFAGKEYDKARLLKMGRSLCVPE